MKINHLAHQLNDRLAGWLVAMKIDSMTEFKTYCRALRFDGRPRLTLVYSKVTRIAFKS